MPASYTHKCWYVGSTKQGKIAGPCLAWIEATAKNSLGNGIIRTAMCTPEKNLNTLLK